MHVLYDAGHEWLIVSAKDLADANMARSDFSQYSYKHPYEGRYALELDCDGPKFIEATGVDVSSLRAHDGGTYAQVRSWPSIIS